MNKDELRPIRIGSVMPKDGYFHKWITKVFNDEPGCEHAYALIETVDGSIKNVPAEEIRFTDRSQ